MPEDEAEAEATNDAANTGAESDSPETTGNDDAGAGAAAADDAAQSGTAAPARKKFVPPVSSDQLPPIKDWRGMWRRFMEMNRFEKLAAIAIDLTLLVILFVPIVSITEIGDIYEITVDAKGVVTKKEERPLKLRLPETNDKGEVVKDADGNTIFKERPQRAYFFDDFSGDDVDELRWSQQRRYALPREFGAEERLYYGDLVDTGDNINEYKKAARELATEHAKQLKATRDAPSGGLSLGAAIWLLAFIGYFGVFCLRRYAAFAGRNALFVEAGLAALMAVIFLFGDFFPALGMGAFIGAWLLLLTHAAMVGNSVIEVLPFLPAMPQRKPKVDVANWREKRDQDKAGDADADEDAASDKSGADEHADEHDDDDDTPTDELPASTAGDADADAGGDDNTEDNDDAKPDKD